jgi:hypothetical protein
LLLRKRLNFFNALFEGNTMNARINLGNTSITGFVNFVSTDGKRLIIGTGSYKSADGTTVFKGNLTAFINDGFKGEVPVKGDFVRAQGDLGISVRKPQDGKPAPATPELQATMDIRVSFQLKKEAPPAKKTDAPATASAGADDI